MVENQLESIQNVLSSSSYSEFKKKLQESGCRRCTLSDSRTQIVVDRGNPEARVLFIGEAPGENEDLQGKAFVGRSGKLLDAVLAEVGFDTEVDGIIVNVVKCRPPKNRAPSPDESSACSDFLKKQVGLLRPAIVIFLGAVAFNHFYPEKKSEGIRDRVGSFFEDSRFPGSRLMAFYHPAYILRDPRKRPIMVEHARRFSEAWKSLPQSGNLRA